MSTTFTTKTATTTAVPAGRKVGNHVMRSVGWLLVVMIIFAEAAEIIIPLSRGQFKPQEHFAYFTTWTSCLIAFCTMWILYRPKQARLQFWLLGNLAVSASIVSLVYWELVNTPGYWYVSSELILHTLAPITTVIFFGLFSWQHGMRTRGWQPLTWIVVPLAYAIFVIVVGLGTKWYPYDFFNADKYGWGHTFGMMGALLGAAVIISYVLWTLVVLLPKWIRHKIM